MTKREWRRSKYVLEFNQLTLINVDELGLKVRGAGLQQHLLVLQAEGHCCLNRDPSGTQVRNSGLSRRFRDSWQLCTLPSIDTKIKFSATFFCYSPSIRFISHMKTSAYGILNIFNKS